jgi:hypothetical protein
MSMDKIFIVGAGRDDEQKQLNATLEEFAKVKAIHAAPGGALWLVHVEIETEPDDDD